MKQIKVPRFRGRSEILSGLQLKIGIYRYALVANRQQANVKRLTFKQKREWL